MANNGKQGEQVFSYRMKQAGYTVQDVSNNPDYWTKDIDFLITSPTTSAIRSFEVKWDARINQTGNLYLELANVHSKGGKGWFSFCEADYLAYGDAQTKVFYVIDMQQLRERIKHLPDRQTSCGTDSIGRLVALRDIQDLVKTI